MGNSPSNSPRASSNQPPPRQHQPPPQHQHYHQQQQPPQPQLPPQTCYYPPPRNFGYSAPPYAPNYNGSSSSGWPPAPVAPPPPPTVLPPHVQQNAKKIKNDVNVHKDSIRVMADESNPDQFLVSFVLDAMFDGSITIYFFAKEDVNNGKITPLMPEAFEPVKVSFQKGVGQKFCQAPGTGIDLGFFELDELARPSPDGSSYPLVISAEICYAPHQRGDEDAGHSSPSLQITQAVLEKNNAGPFQVKVVKQILWIDGERYEVRELYGIANSSEKDDADDSGKECVICMTEPKDTLVMPCRHLCMCSECAEQLRLQSSKCPICRQPITELIRMKLE